MKTMLENITPEMEELGDDILSNSKNARSVTPVPNMGMLMVVDNYGQRYKIEKAYHPQFVGKYKFTTGLIGGGTSLPINTWEDWDKVYEGNLLENKMKTIEIKEEFQIPGTEIILEAGDVIHLK